MKMKTKICGGSKSAPARNLCAPDSSLGEADFSGFVLRSSLVIKVGLGFTEAALHVTG